MTGAAAARAITDAQNALVHQLRAWNGDNPETLAAEYVQTLMSQGWRPTAARPHTRPNAGQGPITGPTDTYRQARAAYDQEHQ